ncbi:hypothetical protein KKF34_16695 [Myxococcota bacterium]|nr:hypothetical protein [Myxococcota bacterium]MBU1379770.1 hypothetical protein [Myxococcota bacterium]MBU1498517.1 hypothetical protein [Myxococcota bacterium]
MKKIIITSFVLFTVIFSTKAQAQADNPYKIMRNNGFIEFGLSVEGGFLKNEYGDFKFADGGGGSLKWFLCWGNHCFGLVLEVGGAFKGDTGNYYRPGDVSVIHVSLPPFGYRYLIKPFFIEVMPHLYFLERSQSGASETEFALAVKGGITKEFEFFRVGASAGLIVCSEFVIGSFTLFTGIVF